MVIWTLFIEKHLKNILGSYCRNTKKLSACLEKRASENKKDVCMKIQQLWVEVLRIRSKNKKNIFVDSQTFEMG